ncbi:MAG: ATP synthase F1 subunit epsilon [Magnetococcales bacterium]|nr:ATP synthase F1 subunit epsilon [Magnetococcales bacterium]
MSAIYQLKVITPEKLLLDQEATFLIAPGAEGCFGVFAGHAPLVSLLKAGELSVGWGDNPERYAVSAGYAEVLADRVTILVEQAVAQSDIDPSVCHGDIAEAEKELASLSPVSFERAYWEKRRDFAAACVEVQRKKLVR